MIQIKVDTREAIRWLTDIQRKQIPFATALALTRTAKAAQKQLKDEFKRVFDRPTPYTMNSLWTKTAKPNDLTAMVYMKDKAIGGGQYLSSAELLGHHFGGGPRERKRLEYRLQQNGFIESSEYIVPGQAAKLDRYGNMNRGQIVQVMSQIGIKNMGSDSSPTTSKRSRRNVAKAGVIFWSHGPQANRRALIDKATGISYGWTGGAASRLPKGAWMRNGRSVKPIMLVVKRVSYKKRIDMTAIVQRVADEEFPKQFNAALRRAIETAR